MLLTVASFVAQPVSRPSVSFGVIADRLEVSAIAAIAAFLLWRLVLAAIDRFFARRFVSRLIPRVATFSSLAKSIGGFAVIVALALLLLNVWAINIAPALWSAGIVTAALAFGAQATVRDILTGFYCLIEDQYDVGDRVELTTPNGVVAGTIDAVSLRSTRVVDLSGRVTTIPNGNIVFVTNASRLPNRCNFSVPLRFHEKVADMQQRLTAIAVQAAAQLGVASQSIAVGVDAFSADGASFRIEFEAPEGDADGVSAKLRQHIAAELQTQGWLPGGAPAPP
ncbi:MAG: mechanosensitive ion channel family protein [Candidatus Eremiobacteraeota bacterium]|nr:mechanosensitive ion channel family protein [Candidatus Eremiobacteraeota bacterium]